MSKKLNEVLEMLSALVELHNENKVINNITWQDAGDIVKKYEI